MINFIGKTKFKELDKVEKLVKQNQEEYSDYLGWTNEFNSTVEIEKIYEYAKEIRAKYNLVIVCGAGGSYTGARAIIESAQGELRDLTGSPKILFLGNNLSSRYFKSSLELIQNYNACMIVISKSGETIETNIAYQLVKNSFEKKYTDVSERVYVITNDKSGYLLNTAKREGYRRLVVPENVGGRYSLHTAVGLLPMAAVGIDIDEFLRGIRDYKRKLVTFDNPSVQYALSRKELYDNGKNKEFLVSYDPSLKFLQEWYVQLFGESEGKSDDVIFPTYLTNTTDLHSIGQYIQEGPGDLFETVIFVNENKTDLEINLEEFSKEYKGLNKYSLNKINNVVMEATKVAHSKNNIDTLMIETTKIDEYSLGQLVYFFMYACFVSSILFGANPFNQPGVEQYKQIYKKLLR